MPLNPKIPLSIRLKALKQAFLWVLGGDAQTPYRLRHLTHAAPGLKPIEVEDSQNKEKPEISKDDQKSFSSTFDERTKFRSVSKEQMDIWRPFTKLKEDSDPRIELLIQEKMPSYLSHWGSSSLGYFMRTAIFFAWKNQVHDLHLLEMAQTLFEWSSNHQTLSNKEQVLMEAAFSLEEPIQGLKNDEFEKKWEKLSVFHQVWLSYLAAALKIPNHVFTHSLEIRVLDKGLNAIGYDPSLDWLSWNALFDNKNQVENILKTGVSANRLSGFSKVFYDQIFAEINHWQNSLKIIYPNLEVSPILNPFLMAKRTFNPPSPMSFKTQNVPPMHWLGLFESPRVLSILLKNGADPNFKINNDSHTHTPLALMILRNQWENALNMLESGAHASTNAGVSDSIFFADSPLWAVMVKVFDEDNSVQEKVCEKLCEAFYKESGKDTSEWCKAYDLCMNQEVNLIRNFHYLLKDQKRAEPWMQKMSFGYNIRETALPFLSPIKIDQLKEMAYHDFNLSSYFYQTSNKEYSTYIFHPLITLAPEALETWLEQDVQKGHHFFQALMKVKTIGMDSFPSDFVEGLDIPKEKIWYKDENAWILALRSSHPKMVLSAFKKFNAPQDFLYDSSSQHQDIWEMAMAQKSGERLVEFLCQEFGGPKWEGRDGNCSEMYHWMSKPRNEDEIESVLSMNILKLDRVVSKKTNNTLLHMAVLEKDSWLFETLITYGADLDALNETQESPRALCQALNWGFEEIARGEQKRLHLNLLSSKSSVHKKRI